MEQQAAIPHPTLRMERVRAESAIDWTPHGHAYVNPYNGCTMGCPFCYWPSLPGWEGRLEIRENLPELLDRTLAGWPEGERLYMGSVCDPFPAIEAELGLTRQCLEVIRAHRVKFAVMTSATNGIALQYADLLRSMQALCVIELARIPFLECMRCGGTHPGIQNANRLMESGLTVWATLAPILPGVTDLPAVLAQLDARIPVYVDRLQSAAGTLQGDRVMAWVRRAHPELTAAYAAITERGDSALYDALLAEFQTHPRVRTFPLPL